MNQKIGIIGGGQLGRMILQEAMNLNLDIRFLDTQNAPCQNNSNHFTVGDIRNFDDVYNFGKELDVISIEIENINTKALKKLELEGKKVYPQPHIIELIQDKGLQKNFYKENNIPTAPYQLHEVGDSFNFEFPFIHKCRVGGYDGKGVQKVNNIDEFNQSFQGSTLIEEMIPFKKELSVIVSRNEKGEMMTYPIVEQEFNPEANLVEFLFSPSDVGEAVEEKGREIACSIIEKLDMVGILAVEFFLTESNELLVNEIAPRPHNSGHHTIEGNYTSQFEQHLRAILNLPLGNTEIIEPAVMINVLGAKGFTGRAVYKGMEEALSFKGVSPHLYGKLDTKPFRKMGHITVTNPSLDEAKKIALEVKNIISVESE